MIKATVKHTGNNFTYPCMMVDKKSTQIVLFEKFGVGTRVYSEVNENTIGYYSTSWSMNDFEDFTDTLVMTNKEKT